MMSTLPKFDSKKASISQNEHLQNLHQCVCGHEKEAMAKEDCALSMCSNRRLSTETVRKTMILDYLGANEPR